MGVRLRSWWQQIKQHLVTILTVAIILIVAIALIIVGYRFDWTGFNGNNKSGKTLRDWLQLLIIPAVLAAGGYLFTFTISRNERKAAARHNQTDHEIAQDNQREAAWQEYIDKLSELLLHEKLRESQPEDEVRNIARVRTLTVLPRLDSMRKRSVLQFLHESGLIDTQKPIVKLEGADLSGADLRKASLSGANLRNANLRGANLSGAILMGTSFDFADLSGANLSLVDLTNAQLNYTKLPNANLAGANLMEAVLIVADLSYAFLKGACLCGACFMDTDLKGADLRETELAAVHMEEYDLEGAYLIGADLRGANFSGADVTPEQLAEVELLQGATMPDGSLHP